MKRLALTVVIAACMAVALGSVGAPAATARSAPADDPPEDAGDRVELVVFHGEGCPHCERMLEFVATLAVRHPSLEVIAHEVWYDRANQEIFGRTMAALGEEPRAVPTVVVGGLVFVGDQDSTRDRVAEVVDALVAGRPVDATTEFTVDVPFVGSVDVGSRSLVGATALIALVDGVNPCSLWVLSMLLALVVHSGSRGRVFAVGALFLVITSLLYGLYMLGAYTTLALMGRRAWIRVAVAVVAGAFGLLHLKEHWTSRGPSVTIGSEHKPGLFRRMRVLADTDRSLPATLAGTAVLAVGVSLLETPCTAGLPLLWTDLVAARDVPSAGVAFLFAVYLAVFLFDELVIFGAAVVTMRATKLQEHHGQVLQLVGGTLMLTLAVAMLVAPTAMESITGTALVFAVAASVSVVVLVAEWAWDRRRLPRGPKFSGPPRTSPS